MIKDLKFTPSWKIQKCRFTVSLVCVSSGLPKSGCQDDMSCRTSGENTWEGWRGASPGCGEQVWTPLQVWGVNETGEGGETARRGSDWSMRLRKCQPCPWGGLEPTLPWNTSHWKERELAPLSALSLGAALGSMASWGHAWSLPPRPCSG